MEVARQRRVSLARVRRARARMADVAIFLLYLADATGIDLSAAVESKVKASEAKYQLERDRG